MTASATIRVLIADDHDLLRFGLALFLETQADIRLVGEATDGAEAIAECLRLQPDVVVLDLVMPEVNGIEACRVIRQMCPQTQVVALTSVAEEKLVQETLQAGALSYILKNIAPGELADVIRAAYRGEPVLAHEAMQALINAGTLHNDHGYRLTRREKEVLNLMIEGLTNLEIAERLTVTHSTVKKHVSNILTKLQSSTRTEAVAFAIQHKLTGS